MEASISRFPSTAALKNPEPELEMYNERVHVAVDVRMD